MNIIVQQRKTSKVLKKCFTPLKIRSTISFLRNEGVQYHLLRFRLISTLRIGKFTVSIKVDFAESTAQYRVFKETISILKIKEEELS